MTRGKTENPEKSDSEKANEAAKKNFQQQQSPQPAPEQTPESENDKANHQAEQRDDNKPRPEEPKKKEKKKEEDLPEGLSDEAKAMVKAMLAASKAVSKSKIAKGIAKIASPVTKSLAWAGGKVADGVNFVTDKAKQGVAAVGRGIAAVGRGIASLFRRNKDKGSNTPEAPKESSKNQSEEKSGVKNEAGKSAELNFSGGARPHPKLRGGGAGDFEREVSEKNAKHEHVDAQEAGERPKPKQ